MHDELFDKMRAHEFMFMGPDEEEEGLEVPVDDETEDEDDEEALGLDEEEM